MDSLLNNLPNGGAVVAIIVMTIVFLKHIAEARKDYITHLKELTDHLKDKPKPK